MLHHTVGCVHNDDVCWIDGDGTEWHRGVYTGVYRVRQRAIEPPPLVCDFLRENNVTFDWESVGRK